MRVMKSKAGKKGLFWECLLVPLAGVLICIATNGWILLLPFIAIVLVLIAFPIHEWLWWPQWFNSPDYHCTTCRLRAEARRRKVMSEPATSKQLLGMTLIIIALMFAYFAMTLIVTLPVISRIESRCTQQK